MRFFFTMFYNCTKFQNNPRGSVEKHPKICWIDMEWPISVFHFKIIDQSPKL